MVVVVGSRPQSGPVVYIGTQFPNFPREDDPRSRSQFAATAERLVEGLSPAIPIAADAYSKRSAHMMTIGTPPTLMTTTTDGKSRNRSDSIHCTSLCVRSYKAQRIKLSEIPQTPDGRNERTHILGQVLDR